VEALKELGVCAETSARNDIITNGKKFSGNARYLRNGRLMHHGTILFDTDLGKMMEVLRVPEDKIVSKGVKSILARVTNLRDHLTKDMTAIEFRTFLRKSIVEKRNMSAYTMTEQDWIAVEAIRRQRYATWEWNYGKSPDYSIRKRRRLPGFGEIQISMQVEDGRITAFATSDDYFGSRRCAEIAAVLLHARMDRNALFEALYKVPLREFCEDLSLDEFIRLILE
jgi:lipoate-protein ligase A